MMKTTKPNKCINSAKKHLSLSFNILFVICKQQYNKTAIEQNNIKNQQLNIQIKVFGAYAKKKL